MPTGFGSAFTGSGYERGATSGCCQEVNRFVSHFVHVAAPNEKLRFLTVL